MKIDLPRDVRSHREWLISLVPVPEAGLWVDLGCGGGEDLVLAASMESSPNLRLIGFDSGKKAIASAERRVNDSRILLRAEKLELELPLESSSVDILYSNNLLECFSDVDTFVQEAARVLKPNGWILAGHWDWDSQIYDSEDKQRVRRLVAAWADWQQGWMDHCDGWMGRRLWGTFNGSGRFEGKAHARVLINTEYAEPWYGHARAQDFGALARRGLIDPQDYREFLREQKELNARGKYFYSITGFAYVAQTAI